MKTTVVYGSRYGTAEKYARRLAQLLECEVVSANAFAGAYSDERVIFVGSLYAQRVTALKKTIKRIAPGASVWPTPRFQKMSKESHRRSKISFPIASARQKYTAYEVG